MSFVLITTTTEPTSVVRLWTPRLSPRRNHKFHWGSFSRGENIWDTLGGCAYATDRREK